MRSEALRKSGASVICCRSRAPRDRSIIAGDRSLAASRCVSVSLSVRFAPRDRAFRTLPSSSSSSRASSHVRCHRSARDTNTHLRAFTSVAPTRRSRQSVKGVSSGRSSGTGRFFREARSFARRYVTDELKNNKAVIRLCYMCIWQLRALCFVDELDFTTAILTLRDFEAESSRYFISMITWEM